MTGEPSSTMTAPDVRSRRTGVLVFALLFVAWFVWTARSHHRATRPQPVSVGVPASVAPVNRPAAADLPSRDTAAAPPAAVPASPEATAEACRNRLKNLGLAARMAAANRDGKLPDTFQELGRNLTKPVELICPGDAPHLRSVPAGWPEFSSNSTGYVLVTPGAEETSPTTVYLECPLHGLVLYADGFVDRKK